MKRRISRSEKQAKTRSSLLKAAAKVFCRHGLEGASIDEVSAEAGYTKGAFYANFKSKEELFLVMLDEPGCGSSSVASPTSTPREGLAPEPSRAPPTPAVSSGRELRRRRLGPRS